MSRFLVRSDAISPARAAALAVPALLLMLLFEATLPAAHAPADDTAARIAVLHVRDAQRALAARRDAASPSPDALREVAANDAGRTGLVGVEWSHLVTTPGSLDAKRLSCDPRWAALFVRWYRDAGVGPGSHVAIASSGSFPGLLLSARVAAETLGARPVVVASLTSSNFGATVPWFDLFHMEEALLAGGFVAHPMALLTPGGDDDAMAGYEADARAAVLARLHEVSARPGAPATLVPADLRAATDAREALLLGGPDARATTSAAVLVNIGGHPANYGVGATALALPTGLVLPGSVDVSRTGGDSLVLRALRRGVPVLNMINVRGIAADNAPFFPADSARAWTPAHRVAAALMALALLALGAWHRARHDNAPPHPHGETTHAQHP